MTSPMTPEQMATMAYRARWAERAVVELYTVVNHLSYEDYERVLDLIEDYPE